MWQQVEHEGHVLDSPQHHCLPLGTPGTIPLPHFNPPVQNAGPIPFAMGQGNAAPVQFGAIHALQIGAAAAGIPVHLPPAPAPAHDPFGPVQANMPIQFNGVQYNNMPAALAQQLAALPPLPDIRPAQHGWPRHQPPPAPFPVILFVYVVSQTVYLILKTLLRTLDLFSIPHLISLLHLSIHLLSIKAFQLLLFYKIQHLLIKKYLCQ